jgi:hypothetical protein
MSVFDAFQNLFGAKPDAGPVVANYLQKPSGIVNATHPIDGNAPVEDTTLTAPPSPGAGNPGVLAQLPSALRAKAAAGQPDSSGSIGGGGLGDVLAAGADAGKGHSAWGAFGAGFAKGLQASSAYDDKQSDRASKSQKDQLESFKTLFGIQHQQTADAETGRHNAATEANAATSTSNLGKYYSSLADKAEKDPANDKPLNNSNAFANLRKATGYMPGDAAWELKTDDQKEADRAAFRAAYKESFHHDAPDDLTPFAGSPIDLTTEVPGTAANPAKDPAHPTLTTDPPAPRPPVRNIPITPPPAAPPAAPVVPPAAPNPAATAVPPQPPAGPVRIKDANEYHALPPGTPYIDPNGVARTKP